MNSWFSEEIYHDFYKQTLKKNKEFVNEQTLYQKIEIFENPFFGKILALDGVIQTTERDEFFYHEMFVHVPLFSHHMPTRILIIGGGDGGILRETLRHKSINKVVMIEIDEKVTEYCKKYMPSLSLGAFDDKRADVRFIDGIEYIKETNDKFDIILVDSTDPVNIATPLFTEEFYRNCSRILGENGILVTQSGVPFYQKEELENILKKLKPVFNNVTCFLVPVPTYVGGFMTLSFSSQTLDPKTLHLEKIKNKILNSKIENLKYYNCDIHLASFIIPNYIKNML